MKPLPWIVAVVLVAFVVGAFGDFNDATSVPAVAPPVGRPVAAPAPHLESVPAPVAPLAERREQKPEQQPPAVPLDDDVVSLELSLAGVLEELDTLHEENRQLHRRLAWLETELALCGSEVTQGPTGRWLASLLPEERPPAEAIRFVAGILREYPVEVTSAEGLWIVERFKLDDWGDWGPTADEAIIQYLGPARIGAQVPRERLEELRAEWSEEGYFGD